MLRSRGSRREKPLGEQQPEPTATRANGADPEREALLADSVGPALLVVLDTLAPAERVVFGFTIIHGRIVEIDILADPERLDQLDLAMLN